MDLKNSLLTFVAEELFGDGTEIVSDDHTGDIHRAFNAGNIHLCDQVVGIGDLDDLTGNTQTHGSVPLIDQAGSRNHGLSQAKSAIISRRASGSFKAGILHDLVSYQSLLVFEPN